MTRLAPPFWQPPARLPADLPAHEVWVERMPVRLAGTPSPHPPTTAPGYERARRLGLLPPPAPEVAPSPLPGLNSVQTLVALGVGAVLAAVVAGRVDPWAVPVVALAATVAGALLYRHLLRRTDAEQAAGYTHFAGERGLWRLSPVTGAVTREPDRTVLPSGFYPSPYYPGVLQKWEGPDWAFLQHRWYRPRVVGRYFRAPTVDFLGPAGE